MAMQKMMEDFSSQQVVIGGTKKPLLRVPVGACDCHMHFFLPEVPTDPKGPPPPFPFTVPMYQAIQKRLGLHRVVVVQPSAYQADNRMVVEAVRQLGPSARGVGLILPHTTEAEIDHLTRCGIIGQRIHHLPGGVIRLDSMMAVMEKVHAFGWHANLQLHGHDLPTYEEKIRKLPGRFVIDHVARLADAGSEALKTLLRLLDTGRCWIKLSGPYESSQVGAPTYRDVADVARILIKHAPERMIWGSNCPFPLSSIKGEPDFADLLDLMLSWVPDEATRHKIFVTNPVELYGF